MPMRARCHCPSRAREFWRSTPPGPVADAPGCPATPPAPWALGNRGQILEARIEVRVIEEEAVDGAFEDHNAHVFVALDRGHDRPELPHELRPHEIERRIVHHD